MIPIDFNVAEYYLLNPDLKNLAQYQLRKHYLNYGYKEQRKYKIDVPDDFDCQTYKYLHNDISTMSDIQAKLHYFNHGRQEGRAYKLTDREIITKQKILVFVLFHVGNITVFNKILCECNNLFKSSDKYQFFYFVTIQDNKLYDYIKSKLNNVLITFVENKGCDIGGFLVNVRNAINHPQYKTVDHFIVMHTKSNDYWRQTLLNPFQNNLETMIKEIANKDVPIIVGADEYVFDNYFCINQEFIEDIFFRNKIPLKIKLTKALNVPHNKGLFFNKDFYKFNHIDLINLSENDAQKHWFVFGQKEPCRLINPNYIVEYGDETYFIAGTIFMCNRKLISFFENININDEFGLLENGYTLNTVPRRTHSWEYFFGIYAYNQGGYVRGIKSNMIREHSLSRFDVNIYKKANPDLNALTDNQLYKHYIESGCKEKRICSVIDLKKKTALINIEFDKSKLAFFLIIPTDTTSGDYRTLLKYISFLEKNDISTDIYFGNSTSDMATCMGINCSRYDINNIVKIIEQYNEIDITKHNFYLGFNAQRHYEIIVANGWQTAEAVFLNRRYCKKIAYIIQDREELFYKDEITKKKVVNTYKPEFYYYCLSAYLVSYFKNTYELTNVTTSCLGYDPNVYQNKHEEREKSVVIAYYPHKQGRLPDLCSQIISYLNDKNIKTYVFPCSYEKQSANIINIGIKTITELNEIYNKCTVGIVFSNTNPSRLGFEMLGSGLKVIEYDSDFTRYDMSDTYFTKIKSLGDFKNVIEKVMYSLDIDSNEYLSKISITSELTNVLNFFKKML